MKTRARFLELSHVMKNQKAEFDGLADDYEQLLADPLRSRFASSSEFYHRRKLEVLRTHLAATGKLACNLRWLDLGCGRGDLLRMGRAEFESAYGCDVSRDSLKYCEGITVREQKTTDSIPFDSRSFDLVTAACVYHHVALSERLKLTRSALDTLRPGGLFVMFEHNPWNPVTRAIVRRSRIDVSAILLRPTESIELLREAGFLRVSLHYFLFLPEAAGAKMTGVEKWLCRVPLGGQYAVFGETPG
jgi:SAM-dependent methyltransferase